MAKLRVINRGTRYDVAGNLRRLLREIESGEIKPHDVVILTTQTVRNNASPTVTMHHYGTGTAENIHWMLATAQHRIEPA